MTPTFQSTLEPVETPDATEPATDPRALSLDPTLLDLLIQEHDADHLPKLERFWDYYRNAMEPAPATHGLLSEPGRWYSLAQEQGLPSRITGTQGASHFSGTRREIVIENDIAWRVHTMVDFMFGKPVSLQSAPDPARALLIESFLRQVFELNGGLALFQDMALLGSIYGYVDVLVRVADAKPQAWDGSVEAAAGLFTLELIEGPRAIPVLHPGDYRKLDGYVLHYRRWLNEVEPAARDGFLGRLRDRIFGGTAAGVRRAGVECTEVWTDRAVLQYEGSGDERVLVESSINALGRIPVVHIQNLAQPFFYEGLSEVEPLIPLQDELNTRLSDRANRVTFQSFKMYLGKGIDGFIDRPVGPGQMWATDNENASIEAFGGDAASPSEESHVGEIREAMDKASAVTTVAAGLINGKVGNLTSENALRITMMGLLARTDKKRVTYGVGIARVCELILHAAETLGIFPNTPQERRVRLDWPSPLPEDTTSRLRDAQLKLQIGVPAKQVLSELGYGEMNP